MWRRKTTGVIALVLGVVLFIVVHVAMVALVPRTLLIMLRGR